MLRGGDVESTDTDRNLHASHLFASVRQPHPEECCLLPEKFYLSWTRSFNDEDAVNVHEL